MMVNSTHSAENLAIQFRDFQDNNKEATQKVLEAFVRETLIEQGLGVYDATDEEISRLLSDSDPWPASYIFADIISRRTQVGWSTHGHSGLSPIYSIYPYSHPSHPPFLTHTYTQRFPQLTHPHSRRRKHLRLQSGPRSSANWEPRKHRSRRFHPGLP